MILFPWFPTICLKCNHVHLDLGGYGGHKQSLHMSEVSCQIERVCVFVKFVVGALGGLFLVHGPEFS
jgi:hypothetical protein